MTDLEQVRAALKQLQSRIGWSNTVFAFDALDRVAARLAELEGQVAAIRLALEWALHNPPGTPVPEFVDAALASDAGQRAAAVLRAAKAYKEALHRPGYDGMREALSNLTKAVAAWED